MNLRQYDGKKVKILANNGKVFVGFVTDYIFPEDNEPEGFESIIIETDDDRLIEFYEHEIKSIEII